MATSGAHERGLLMACLVVLAGLVAADVAGGQSLTLSGTYGLCAVLASALLSARLTVVCAAAALTASVLSFLWNDSLWWGWAIRVLIVIALSATAVVIAVTRERRERRLAQMTVIAEVAQRAVLRAIPTAIGPVGFAARYVSAAEEARIGGDLYEVVATQFGTRAIVGDVRGKGLEAVQLAATVLGAFRRSAFIVDDLTDVARDLDHVVSAVADLEDFVTAVLVQFSDDGVLQVVNVAHMPPILVEAGPAGAVCTARALDTGHPVPPLGLHPEPTLTIATWTPGTRLLLYTDGTTEGRDRAGQFFELTSAASALGSGTLDEALDRLIDALTTHVGHDLTDDVALVLAEYRRDAALRT
jgi:phosphoserine phosphatase RsbU/P